MLKSQGWGFHFNFWKTICFDFWTLYPFLEIRISSSIEKLQTFLLEWYLSLLRNGLHYKASVWLGARGETVGRGGWSMERVLDGDPLISLANTEVDDRESGWQSGCLPVPCGWGFWDPLLRRGVSGAVQDQAHPHNIRDHRKLMGAWQGVHWRWEVLVVSQGSSRARLQSRKNPANQSLARLQTKTSREGGLPLPGGSVITRRVCEWVLSRAVEVKKAPWAVARKETSCLQMSGSN